MEAATVEKEKIFLLPVLEALKKLGLGRDGLTEAEARKRQRLYGLNVISAKNRLSVPTSIFIRQLTGNPLIIILAAATFISFLLGQSISSYYIFSLIIVSVLFGFWNEFSAERTIENLLRKISPVSLVSRGGEKKEIPVSELTVGDIVFLSQGSIIPADVRFIETRGLEVNESILSGESVLRQKRAEPLFKPPNDYSNRGFMGTDVVSGSGVGVVVSVGKETEFGKIAKSSVYSKPETEFQKGLSRFGGLIIKVVLILTSGIFLVNSFLGHNVLESLLFSLAIAVGLTPELLPVIVTVSLSHGAGRLVKKHVVVKRLISIENLGNLDVLCTDKTGTLTEGKIEVVDLISGRTQEKDHLLLLSLICNSAVIHHKVIGNAIDSALWDHAIKHRFSLGKSIKKLDEAALDYKRKAMFTVFDKGGEVYFVVKGAPESVVGLCRNSEGLAEKFRSLSEDGYRVIAVASKKIIRTETYSWDEAKGLDFNGFITFLDIPKKTAKEALTRLKNLGVEVKILTGDNETVTKKVCQEVGFSKPEITTGSEIENLTEADFTGAVLKFNVFARLNPEQKLRIIKSLQKLGHTVGFLGDGINDLPSLHGGDVGISVNSAVDVAKDTASVVLLQKNLGVLADGIVEGRKTFSNTLKYILMGTSSNFGNMLSAAGASFFLPFLPMTPAQILLTNGLYDISQMSLPSDNVDHEYLLKPRHWNVDFIKRYMLFFGPLSSLYDYLTFGVMIFFFRASGSLFQTGWFIESIATEILVVFLIRTARTPFFLSRPSKWLILTCLLTVAAGLALPFSPLARSLGFTPLPPVYLAALIFLVVTYLLLIETMKGFFLRRYRP